MTVTTEDRLLVTMTLAGIDTGTWDTLTGREMDSEGDMYRPGVGQTQRANGGPKTFSDITVTRTYDATVDAPLVRALRTKGSCAGGSLTESELDCDYNAFGEQTTWPVRLKGIKTPDLDIDSGNRKKLEITLWVDGDPS